jgi:uncharacterized low-complexity protein
MVAMKTAKARFWIEILALTSSIACAFALLLAVLGTVTGAADAASTSVRPESSSSAASDSPASDSYEGIITDTHCGAKHSAAVGMTAADCTRVCVHSGEHFALVDGDKAYTLEGDIPALKQLAGQRAKVVGTLSGNTISVASVGGF